MKTCPSCNSELADDAAECLCGYSYADGEPAPAEPEEVMNGDEPEFDESEFGMARPESEGMPATKSCVFCYSEIATPAMRCPHCAGFLPIAEGTIFKQYFFFLFSCLAIGIGCLLPWERSYQFMNLTGVESISGAFLFVFAVYGAIASVWNIYHRKMIVWPVMLAALDGAIFGISRMVKLYSDAHVTITATGEFGQFVQKVRGYLQVPGPGLYLVSLFSVLVLFSVVMSVFKGAKEDARRKDMEREARASARKTRR